MLCVSPVSPCMHIAFARPHRFLGDASSPGLGAQLNKRTSHDMQLSMQQHGGGGMLMQVTQPQHNSGLRKMLGVQPLGGGSGHNNLLGMGGGGGRGGGMGPNLLAGSRADPFAM
jgi:hypothetical protein